MPKLEIIERAALDELLAGASSKPGYVAVAIVGGRSESGRKKERQVGRVDCPEPRLLRRLAGIFTEAVPPAHSAKLRIRRYDAEGNKTEQLVTVTHGDGVAAVEPPVRPVPAPVRPESKRAGAGLSRAPAPEPIRPEAAVIVSAAPNLGVSAPPLHDGQHVHSHGRPAQVYSAPPPVQDDHVLLLAEVTRLTGEVARREVELARRDAEIMRRDAELDRRASRIRELEAGKAAAERDRDELGAMLQAEVADRAAEAEVLSNDLEELCEMVESTPSWAFLLR